MNKNLTIMSTIMNNKRSLAALLLCFVLVSLNSVNACTSFILKNDGNFVVGRNYDYRSPMGIMIINPRNVAKIAIPFPGEKSAKWVSKYGSLTFNSMGRKQPLEGINEAGLIVTALSVDDKPKYPVPDSRPAVDMMQWVQYVLDNYSNVNEVIRYVDAIRISNQSNETLHYLVSDSKGNLVFIEYVEGKLTCYLNDYATSGFICNDYFAKSANDLKKYSFKGGGLATISNFENYNPEEAVVLGASMIDNYNKKESLEAYAFKIMEKVNAPRSTPFFKNYGTQWSIVYDSKERTVSFKTLDNDDKRVIALDKLDFTSSSIVKALSVSESKSTDIYSQFKTFSEAENVEFMNKAVCVFLGHETLPKGFLQEVEMAARFPYKYYICAD